MSITRLLLGFAIAVSGSATCAYLSAPQGSTGEGGDHPPCLFGQPGGREGRMFDVLPGTSPWGQRTITYSFVPDGAKIESLPQFIQPRSEEDNVLFKRMNECFGSEAEWQGIIDNAFRAWSNATGLQFKKVGDDKADYPAVGSSARGDIRFWCRSIDGEEKYFATTIPPTDGDVRFDRAEKWNRDLLSRVAIHEIGHALGLNHVCPCNGTKVMENQRNSSLTISEDEVRGIHYLYGDGLEPNDQQPRLIDLKDLQAAKLSLTRGGRGGDVDQFRIRVAPKSEIRVRAIPTGSTYSVGAGDCGGGGSPMDASAQLALRLKVLSRGGQTLGQTQADVGKAAELVVRVPDDGELVIVLDPAAGSGSVQMYHIQIE